MRLRRNVETEPVRVAVQVEDVAILRSLGVNPGRFAKLVFQEALRTAHTRDASGRFRDLETVLPPGFDVGKLIEDASENP